MALFHKSNKRKAKNARCHKATPAEVKRHKIVALLDFGIKPADICRKMAYSPDLVKKVDKLRRASKSLAANPKGKPLMTRSPQFMQKPMTLSELWTTFNEQGMSDYVVVYLRLLVSKELKKNADFFQFFMEDGKTVEEFCLTEVEPMYRESDHIHITALTRGAWVTVGAGVLFSLPQSFF